MLKTKKQSTSRKGRLFKRPKRASQGGGEYPEWYGRLQVSPKRWLKVKLFTDLGISRRKLLELQRQADMRAEGFSTVEQERLKLPISELVAEYLASLRSRQLSAEHISITENMLNKAIACGEWRTFYDISAASVDRLLTVLATETVSYQNCYLKKIKAFVHWALPEGVTDPLRRLKRRRERGAKRNRARRALTGHEQQAFMAIWPTLPSYRRIAYALAMLNGLRRSNIKALTWGDVKLNATIPFVSLQQKMGDGHDFISLHPHVAALLEDITPGLPLAKVVTAVPDIKTLKKELQRAGVEFVNSAGERADFHALRHTFATSLEATGCSRATKKRLMRHAAEDITDGYTHAELSEMLQSISRVPSPGSVEVQTLLMTGSESLLPCGPLMGQVGCLKVHNSAQSCTVDPSASGQVTIKGDTHNTPVNTANCTPVHNPAHPCLPSGNEAGKLANSRPDTQVD